MAPGNDVAADNPALKAIGRFLSGAIIVAAIVAILLVTRLYYVYPRTDDAYVRANLIGVAPHVSGPIIQLPIVDNQHVHKGEMLFIVDPRPYQATLDALVAKLQLTNLQISGLDDAIRAAGAEQKRREAEPRIRAPISASHRAAARQALRHRQRRLRCAQQVARGRGCGGKFARDRQPGTESSSANTAISTRGASRPRPRSTTRA